MVAEEVFDGHGLGDGVFAHRNASRSSKIILGDGGTCQLIVVADEAGGDAILSLAVLWGYHPSYWIHILTNLCSITIGNIYHYYSSSL